MATCSLCVELASHHFSIFNEIGLQRLLDKRCQLSIVEYEGAPAWALAADDATAALNDLALTLR